jgi:hypothetical protein
MTTVKKNLNETKAEISTAYEKTKAPHSSGILPPIQWPFKNMKSINMTYYINTSRVKHQRTNLVDAKEQFYLNSIFTTDLKQTNLTQWEEMVHFPKSLHSSSTVGSQEFGLN